MEIEERHSWIAYELVNRNFLRMRKAEIIASVMRVEQSKLSYRNHKLDQESGLSFFRGGIVDIERPQNSAAKHHDLEGHIGPINSCKLSKCLKYILSCSNDKTSKLWNSSTGKVLMTYTGHSRKINDCDIHPAFQLNQKDAFVVTCSGDCTIRYWNTLRETSVKILKGEKYYITTS